MMLGGETMDEETETNEANSEDEITKLVSDKEAVNTIFNDPTNLLKDLMDSYGNKNFANTLDNGGKVLSMMDEPTQKFIKAGMAFSISAAVEWVSNLAEVGVDVSEVQGLVSEAKEQFLSEKFSDADKTISKVKDIIPNLEAEQTDAANVSISSTEELVEEAKNIGATVHGAERALQQAKNALEAENFLEVARFAKTARESAENAKEQRIKTISDALIFTSSVIDESRDVGVDTSEPDKLYDRAKTAFEMEDYKKCSELNKEAEDLALKLQDEHIQKVIQLKEKRASIIEKRATLETAPQAAGETGAVAEGRVIPPPGEKPEDICPFCSSHMRYIEKYSRFWCNSCQKYAPKK
jgi:hypothetical protein